MIKDIVITLAALLGGSKELIGVHGAMLLAPCAAMLAGVCSAVLYVRKQRRLDGALALVAGLALAAVLAQLHMPADGSAGGVVTLVTDADAGSARSMGGGPADGAVSAAVLRAIPGASAIVLSGDGLREAQWRDLPARPLQWRPAAADVLDLDFPRTITLGRIFTLKVQRSQPQAGWRLQLLAENKQVLAEASAGPHEAAPQLSVQWLPPVVENLVLQARLLDAAGKTIAQGPVPLQVTEQVSLQVQGRFDAASFDARALNQLLTDGNAILDWQITLGKALSRSETARAAMPSPNAMFADAAYIEHLSAPARAALMAQVAAGLPLVVLGGNGSDSALWQREFGLHLRAQSATTEKEDARVFAISGSALALPPAALNPDDSSEPWSVLARDSKKQPWLWQRSWKQGRVIWIGVADWHRYAISAPQALALWWQGAMDLIALDSPQSNGWQLPDPMPVPGLRSEICAQGGSAGALLRVDGMANMAMQPRGEKADAVCAAFWPQQAGWLRFSGGSVAQPGMAYVYSKTDWPAWQRSLRRTATAQYAARSKAQAAGSSGSRGLSAAVPGAAAASAGMAAAEAPPRGRPMPDMPLVLLFAACMLLLWWREQR